MRADSEAAPARAAMLGHGVAARSAEELCIPTDRAALAFPLVADGQTLAVVYCSTLAARLACAQALSRVMEQAAFPYKIAAEREADRITAVYDPLTGLYTPRAFRDLLREELIAAVGVRAQPLALWFIDTDHFKQVNDTLGHAAGDGVLAQMASLLRDHLVPERDVPARNGGDEFCAVLREVHKVAAVERANAFCDAVRVADFGIDMPITASIGVASYPYDAREASELLQVADSAMYHSKRAGRDCVSFATGPHAFCIYS